MPRRGCCGGLSSPHAPSGHPCPSPGGQVLVVVRQSLRGQRRRVPARPPSSHPCCGRGCCGGIHAAAFCSVLALLGRQVVPPSARRLWAARPGGAGRSRRWGVPCGGLRRIARQACWGNPTTAVPPSPLPAPIDPLLGFGHDEGMNIHTSIAAALIAGGATVQTLAMTNAQGELLIQLIVQIAAMILAFIGGKRHKGGKPTDSGGAGDNGPDPLE